jgi:hypothetical protein
VVSSLIALSARRRERTLGLPELLGNDPDGIVPRQIRAAVSAAPVRTQRRETGDITKSTA